MSNKQELIESSRAQKGSPAAEELSKDFDRAQAALASAKADELYELWEKAIKSQGLILETIGIMSEHYRGKSGTPMYQPPMDVITSMERVALAAIDLAKQISLNGKSGK